MEHVTYFQAVQWLLKATQNDDPTPPPARLCATLAALPDTRGVLLTLLAKIGEHADFTREPSYQQCMHDIPAYIDRERFRSQIVAIRTYPHVWWSLWLYPACARVYELTHSLIEAEQRGDILPFALPILPAEPIILGEVTIAGSLIAQIYRLLEVMGTAQGNANEDDAVLSEDEQQGYAINVTMHLRHKEGGRILVSIQPPVQGIAVLTVRDLRIEFPFDETGIASTIVPASVLENISHHTDLQITIQQNDDPD
ncbi:MAG: hypothetical protein HC893_08685 [Chloroflexaceae bacterium]|nr:hypothetical protein [Chloroflexaceae bacterium]NJL33910.1 hypothetical protein [Chloroflexaceae bacterium]NJO07829.1 hypothetical protein [Chloroflexaceae bacterium]